MSSILPHPVVTIRLAQTVVRHVLQAVRVALYALIVTLAVLDTAIALVALVAIWAWSQLTEGAQS